MTPSAATLWTIGHSTRSIGEFVAVLAAYDIELIADVRRRRPDPDSPNLGWRHPAFRAYADHLETDEFAEGLSELLMLAHGLRTAVMCSELLWWRCHRRLIADVLTWLDYPVINIHDAKKADAHQLSAPARLVRGQLTYRTTASSSRTR